MVDLGPFAKVRSLLDGMQADLDMAAARHADSARAQQFSSTLANGLRDLADRLVAALE